MPLPVVLRIAGVATALSLVLGVWLGYVFRGRRGPAVWLGLAAAPPLAIVAGLLAPPAYARGSGLIAATVFAIAILAWTAHLAFQLANVHYERAARSLGAGEWRIFWRIALPLAWRPLLCCAVLVFPFLGMIVWHVVAST